jgi:T4 superinfection immunity protein/zinc ribbon protein
MLIFPLRMFPFFHFHPIFLLVSLFLYFLPAYLARNKSNFTAILVLNVLTGWTFIGWVIALIWALSSDPQRPAAVPTQPAATAAAQAAAGGRFFCTACGKPCAAGARFCSSCGATLPAAPR